MLAEVDSVELSEWLAYSNIRGLPDSVGDTARLLAHLTNLLSTGKRVSPQDFLPAKGRRNRPQTTAEMRAKMRAFAARRKPR